MLPTIADVAAALGEEPHPDRRAALEALASALLRTAIVRRDVAQMRARLCRLALDARGGRGDDDQRDAAAA